VGLDAIDEVSMNVTGGNSEVRSKLIDLAMSDALNSSRTNDAIREAMTAALLKKVDSMGTGEMLEVIKALDTLTSIEKTQKLLDMFKQ
jgi:hypothetical protein